MFQLRVIMAEEKITEPEMTEDEIDYDVMGTFPCSDPPSWTLGIDCRDKCKEDFERRVPSVNEPSHQHENTSSV